MLLAEKSGCSASSSALVWVMQALASVPEMQDWLCLLGWKRPKGYRRPHTFERQQQISPAQCSHNSAVSSSLQWVLWLYAGLSTLSLPASRFINRKLNDKLALAKWRSIKSEAVSAVCRTNVDALVCLWEATRTGERRSRSGARKHSQRVLH